MNRQAELKDASLGALTSDVGWALRTVSIAFQSGAIEAVRRLPGGPRGYLVLAAVSRGDAESQLALAQTLSIDRTQMTYLLDELQADGLIERVQSPSDRRVRLVRATDDGRRAFQDSQQAVRAVEDQLLAVLGADEQAVLRQLLGRVAAAAADRSSETAAR